MWRRNLDGNPIDKFLILTGDAGDVCLVESINPGDVDENGEINVSVSLSMPVCHSYAKVKRGCPH